MSFDPKTPADREALLESEERLNLALSAAQMGIWDWDMQTGKLKWSPTLELLFGFEPGTFPGTYEAYRARLFDEEASFMEVGLKKAIADRKDHLTEHRIRLSGGKVRWIQGRGRAYYDDTGQAIRMVGTCVDITDRKVAQEALRRTSLELERLVRDRSEALSKSHEFLDSLIENLPIMVFVKDAANLKFVRFNKAGEALLGVSRDGLLGKSDHDFFPKEQADFFISKDRDVLRGHEIVDIPEEPIETAIGTRLLHTKKIPIFGSDGKPEYLLGISEDITEFKRSEDRREKLVREKAARIESERAAERYRFLAEASTCLSSSLKYEDTLQRLSELAVPGFSDWCTITIRDEETGKMVRLAATHSDPAKKVVVDEMLTDYPSDADQSGGIADVMRTGEIIFAQKVEDSSLRRAAKDERHYEMMTSLGVRSCLIVPIPVREKVIGVISMVYGHSNREYTSDDLATAEELGRRAGIAIDNARLYEKAQLAVQMRSEFLSIASHELKTPITSLKLQLQLARRKVDPSQGLMPTPEKLEKALDGSLRQIDRLVNLIENLLDVSRIEAGKLSYSHDLVDLTEVVRDVVDRYRDQFEASQFPIVFKPQGKAELLGDAFRIEQVVVNLFSNALKYGAGKPVEVSVVRKGDVVRLEVCDHGIGIEPALIGRIFDRFQRAITNRNISGLGLGLYISKQIVTGHQGKIWVESREDEGSTFFVEFPAAKNPSI